MTKDDILREIRRTAQENGGSPLGFKRFQDITGIGQYEWRKYWARFGDAQHDAGFSPNTLQGAYDETFVLDKYIGLARELKKLPVRGDLIVKRNTEPDFPTHNVFIRVGTKHIFLSKLLKYAEAKGFNDIISLCNIALAETNTNPSEENTANDLLIGSVYLLKSGKFYKIGRTNSMGRRHHEITILLPDGAELVHEIKTDDPSGIEKYWHRRFEDKRKNGEWFDLSASDVRAFRRWRKII